MEWDSVEQGKGKARQSLSRDSSVQAELLRAGSGAKRKALVPSPQAAGSVVKR